MNAIQQRYHQAKGRNDQLEAEAMRQLRQTKAFKTLPPDWEGIVAQQERIEQALGLPGSRYALQVATEALLDFALAWIVQHGTPEHVALYRKALDTLLPFSFDSFLEVCMTLPEHENPSPIPTFLQELATFFVQQAQEAAEALRQNYALHAAHLTYLEQALVAIQWDQPGEAKAALLAFLAEEEPRRREEARLLAILGQQERSPHAEQQEELLRQLTAALPAPDQPDGEIQA